MRIGYLRHWRLMLLIGFSPGCGDDDARSSDSALPDADIDGSLDAGYLDDSDADPMGPGELVDATQGPDPFDAALTEDASDGSVPCDEDEGDFTPCNVPDGCLTVALCDAIPMVLSDLTAGKAMACIAALAVCSESLIGDCMAYAGQLGCSPSAAAGTAPCDALATVCAEGDPLHAETQCLALAPALAPAVVSGFGDCLNELNECDPSVLGECARAQLP